MGTPFSGYIPPRVRKFCDKYHSLHTLRLMFFGWSPLIYGQNVLALYNGGSRISHRGINAPPGCTSALCDHKTEVLLWLRTLSPAYNQHFDAKKSIRYSRLLVVTKLVVAGILLIVHCSYQGTILSHLMSTNN